MASLVEARVTCESCKRRYSISVERDDDSIECEGEDDSDAERTALWHAKSCPGCRPPDGATGPVTPWNLCAAFDKTPRGDEEDRTPPCVSDPPYVTVVTAERAFDVPMTTLTSYPESALAEIAEARASRARGGRLSFCIDADSALFARLLQGLRGRTLGDEGTPLGVDPVEWQAELDRWGPFVDARKEGGANGRTKRGRDVTKDGFEGIDDALRPQIDASGAPKDRDNLLSALQDLAAELRGIKAAKTK